MLQYGMKHRDSKCFLSRILARVCICLVKWETGRFVRGLEPDAEKLPEPRYSAKDIVKQYEKKRLYN